MPTDGQSDERLTNRRRLVKTRKLSESNIPLE